MVTVGKLSDRSLMSKWIALVDFSLKLIYAVSVGLGTKGGTRYHFLLVVEMISLG